MTKIGADSTRLLRRGDAPARVASRDPWALGLSLVAIAWVLLQVALLWTAGLPATHDGFWHLNWIEAFNHAIFEGGVYPRWYEEAFGGAGSPSFVFYPPGVRLLSLPFGAITDAASIQTRGALTLLLLLHAATAWLLARTWPGTTRGGAALILLAVINPYFLANVWIRGAWSEALAMACLWLVLLALCHARQDRSRAAIGWGALGVAGLFLSHHPTALLVLYAAIPASLWFALRRQWQVIGALMLAAGLGAALAGFHLIPVLSELEAIRLGTGDDLMPNQWPIGLAEGSAMARSFTPLWAWVLAVLVFALALRPRPQVEAVLRVPMLLVGGLALLAMCPLLEPAYRALPQLGRIQFPWRWFALATPAAICLLVGMTPGGRGARFAALALALAGAATAIPALRGIELIPPAASATLDAMLRCERKETDCSAFRAPAALADRFGPLRYLGQHPSHYGPWIHPDGRLWRREVFDYMPRGIRVETWERTERLGSRLPPFMPRPEPQLAPSHAGRVTGVRHTPQRLVADVELSAAAEITLERLRFPGWEVRVRGASGGYAPVEPDAASIYYRFRLAPGQYRLQWRHVGTAAERAGMTLSLSAALLLGLGYRRQRAAARRSKA